MRRHSQNGSISERASLDLPHTSWSALTDILWDIRQKGENFDDRKPWSRPRVLTDLLRVDVPDLKESTHWKGVVRSGLAAKVSCSSSNEVGPRSKPTQSDRDSLQDGSPALCIVMHRLFTTTTDFDSLLRHALLEVSRTTGNFDLLLDCSNFQDDNAAPPDVIELLLTLAPADATERLRKLYIFSPTSAFLHYGRKVAAIIPCESSSHTF